MANKKILGVRSAKGKTGKLGFNYFYSEPFSDYESDNAESIKGVKCGQEFSYKDFNLLPGDEVQFVYEKGYQDKAMLTDIIPVKPVKG